MKRSLPVLTLATVHPHHNLVQTLTQGGRVILQKPDFRRLRTPARTQGPLFLRTRGRREPEPTPRRPTLLLAARQPSAKGTGGLVTAPETFFIEGSGHLLNSAIRCHGHGPHTPRRPFHSQLQQQPTRHCTPPSRQNQSSTRSSHDRPSTGHHDRSAERLRPTWDDMDFISLDLHLPPSPSRVSPLFLSFSMS